MRAAAVAQAMIVVDVQRGWVEGAHAVRGADEHISASGRLPQVPAAKVRRVAEWSLGDEITVVAGIADLAFEPPSG